jgi:hypothetical protein
MSLLDQANNPRRLVAHDDDSVVHSCTYPCATLLGGIPWWIQSDRLSHPLHSLEGQSRPWGVCITPASGGEELHLYSSQVIKDLGGPDPSSLTGSVISRERIAASWCTWLSHAPTTMPHPTLLEGLGVSLGSPLPTFRSPSHPSGSLPCSLWRTQTRRFRWRIVNGPIHSLWLPRRSMG